MKRFFLLAFGLTTGLAGCVPTQQYYVSNVYQHGADIYVERCLLDGRSGTRPDPSTCQVQRADEPPGMGATAPAWSPDSGTPPPPPPPPPAN